MSKMNKKTVRLDRFCSRKMKCALITHIWIAAPNYTISMRYVLFMLHIHNHFFSYQAAARVKVSNCFFFNIDGEKRDCDKYLEYE